MLEPNDHTHQFALRVMRDCFCVRSIGMTSYWQILIRLLAGRSAKLPSLIPRQIFQLYGKDGQYAGI